MGLAIDAYCAPDPPGGFTVFPHYVIGWKGELIQIADERVRARHAAVTADERDAYLSGAWRKRVSLKGQTFWRDRWPRHFSPSNLYPSKSPNEDYIGVELIPLAKAESPGGTLFTPKQYDKLARLIADIESRYGLVLNGSRLVGHEDISPLTRWDKNGGWDPGALRAYPFFRWDLVRPSSSSVLG